jgi:hypothetical protein
MMDALGARTSENDSFEVPTAVRTNHEIDVFIGFSIPASSERLRSVLLRCRGFDTCVEHVSRDPPRPISTALPNHQILSDVRRAFRRALGDPRHSEAPDFISGVTGERHVIGIDVEFVDDRRREPSAKPLLDAAATLPDITAGRQEHPIFSEMPGQRGRIASFHCRSVRTMRFVNRTANRAQLWLVLAVQSRTRKCNREQQHL